MADVDSVFTELFEKYHQSLINYCVSNGVKPVDSEDIVMEAFARALSNSEEILSVDPVQRKTWLYTAVNFIIWESGRVKTATPFSMIENIENYIKDDDEIEQFLTDEICRQCIKQVYETLDNDNDRELFTHLLNRTDYKTLTKIYNKSPEAVRIMVWRFRKKLEKIVNNL